MQHLAPLLEVDGAHRGNRERAVPCRGCHPATARSTWADNALCDECNAAAVAALLDAPAGLEWT